MMTTIRDQRLSEKLDALRRAVRDLGSCVVAYSGGVDSTFLATVAQQELGERSVAVLARSPSIAASELAGARQRAAQLGLTLIEVESDEFARDAYRRNDGERCFHCKDALFGALHRTRLELGLARVAYGYNRDDAGDYRPGQRAAEQHAVASPLADAELGKAEIRELSHSLEIPAFDRPAQPCLASRLHYGTAVEPRYLRLVERVEAFLRARGIADSRARFDGVTLRIEVTIAALSAVASADWRERLVALARSGGATFVALDLEGLVSGKTNRLLGVVE